MATPQPTTVIHVGSIRSVVHEIKGEFPRVHIYNIKQRGASIRKDIERICPTCFRAFGKKTQPQFLHNIWLDKENVSLYDYFYTSPLFR